MSLVQFRKDFSASWKWRRHCGEISEIEMRDGIKREGNEVKENMHDKDWMAEKSAEYATEAAQMRSDLARAERIRAEVRAERAAA